MIYLPPGPRFSMLTKPRFGTATVNLGEGLARGLVAAWLFNEGRGNVVFDVVRGIQATLDTTATWNVGLFGGPALLLSSTTTANATVFAVNADLHNMPEVTVVCWALPRTLGGGNAGSIAGTYNNTVAGWRLRLHSGSGLTFDAITSGTDVVRQSSNSILTLNTWRQFAMVWDGSLSAGGVHIYQDAMEISYATTTNGTGTLDNDNASNFVIGNNTALTTNNFNGWMDMLYIYNRQLSRREIAQLYATPFLPFRRKRAMFIQAQTTTVVPEPSRVMWQPGSPSMTRQIPLTPGQVAWRPGTPSLSRVALLVPASMQWKPGTVTVGRLVVVEPGKVAWQPEAMAFPLDVVHLSPAVIAWMTAVVDVSTHSDPATAATRTAKALTVVVRQVGDTLYVELP